MQANVSIIMTSYNYSEYIAEAIESVIAQTYRNWELIIVDDASSDNSVDIIRRYALKDSRIKLFVHPQNRGLASAVQTGLKNAGAEWIAFLESDDIFMPDALEEKLNAVKNGADMVFTDVEMFGEKEPSEKMQNYFDYLHLYYINLDNSRFIEKFPDIIYRINLIPTFSAVMIKRSILKNCKFNSICKASLDYYLWSQVSEYKIYYLHKKLTKWRIHSDSYISQDKYGWFKKYIFGITLYKNTIKHRNPLLKPFLLLNYMRARLVCFKITKNSFKINFADNRFVLEKKFSKSH